MKLIRSVFPLAACAVTITAHAQDAVTVLSLPPEVAAVVKSLDGELAPQPLARTRMETSFSALNSVLRQDSEYLQLAPNLWGVRTSLRSDQVSSSSESLTLCGLVELMTTVLTTGDRSFTTVIPIGKAFVPLGINLPASSTRTGEVTRLEIPEDSRALCHPAPGTKFSYAVDRKLHSSSRIGSNEQQVSVRATCEAGAAVIPRAPSQVLGDYLPVRCEIQNTQTGSVNPSRWAYLVHSGYYLRLDGGVGRVASEHRYTAAETGDRAAPTGQ
jgi:hypothetical protein